MGPLGSGNHLVEVCLDDTDTVEFYVQSVIGLAPGVHIIPEFAYADVDKDGSRNDTSDYYLGAKWQIDF